MAKTVKMQKTYSKPLLMTIITATLFSLVLSACGSKGALYQTPEPQKQATPKPVPEAKTKSVPEPLSEQKKAVSQEQQ